MICFIEFIEYHTEIPFSVVVNSQEDSLVIGDHCCVRTQLGKYTLCTYYSCYATISPLTLYVSQEGVCRTLNYVQALAVYWCHEPGYHRKSETSGS